MKTFLAIIGGVVLSLWLMGIMGHGKFLLCYGPEGMVCTKEVRK